MKKPASILVLLALAVAIAFASLFILRYAGRYADSPDGASASPRPPPPPQWLGEVDRVLQNLPSGNIAFNAPTTLQLDEAVQIQLILSLQEAVDDLKEQITAVGVREGATLRVSSQMEARLSGFGFQIQPITPMLQAVSAVETTEWGWEIKPIETGSQRLFLTLSAILHIEGEPTPRRIRTFRKTIEVRITLPQRVARFLSGNWQWLLATIVIPLMVWVFNQRRKGGSMPEDEPDESNGEAE